MDIETITRDITQKVRGKYTVSRQEGGNGFRWLNQKGDWNKTVLFFTRNLIPASTTKTLLVARLTALQEADEVQQWCAHVKSKLVDPLNADLYLLIVYEGEDVGLEQCLQIEANDLYCRKYMLRPGESLDQLMERSFLGTTTEITSSVQITDPLQAALLSTTVRHDWLTAGEVERWKHVLLSSCTGAELAQLLFRKPSNPD